MEKDILIQNLKTKVGEDNAKVISDRSFEEIAGLYLPLFADDSKITEESWQYPVKVLSTYAGQKRHDDKEFVENYKSEYDQRHQKEVEERVRKAAEEAVEKYKSEQKDADGGGSGADVEEPAIEDKINEAVKKALTGFSARMEEFGKSSKEVTDYIETLKQREKSARRDQVKGELKKHLVDLKANNEACIDDALDDIEYGDSPTFEGLKQTAISAYEKRYKRYYSDGGRPFGGTGFGGGGGDSLVKEKIERLKAEAAESADYAADLKKSFQ